jgi:hypothetical protein
MHPHTADESTTDLSYSVPIRGMLVPQVQVSYVTHRLKSRGNGHTRWQHFFQDLACTEEHYQLRMQKKDQTNPFL